jgi:hypothetical protein
MTEKNGKSKGIGFVSFDNPKICCISNLRNEWILNSRKKVESLTQ